MLGEDVKQTSRQNSNHCRILGLIELTLLIFRDRIFKNYFCLPFLIVFASFSCLASTTSHFIPISIPSKSIIDIVLSAGGKEIRLSVFPKPQGHESMGEEGILVTLSSPRKGELLIHNVLSQHSPCSAVFPFLLRHLWHIF